MATYKPSWTELFTGIPSGKKIKEMEMEDIASGEIFDDYIKNRIQNLKDKEVLKNLPKISKDEKPKIVPKRKPEPDPKYDGPFGELGEYFSKNADKRDELFDYISAIGQQLVRPTNPGEARGFLSDVSAGLGAGEAKIASKDAAALDSLVKRAQYAQAVDPLQNYTSKMKEVRQDAISRGLEPGTKAYNDSVGARLRGEGVSDEIKTTVDTLDNLRMRM